MTIVLAGQPRAHSKFERLFLLLLDRRDVLLLHTVGSFCNALIPNRFEEYVLTIHTHRHRIKMLDLRQPLFWTSAFLAFLKKTDHHSLILFLTPDIRSSLIVIALQKYCLPPMQLDWEYSLPLFIFSFFEHTFLNNRLNSTEGFWSQQRAWKILSSRKLIYFLIIENSHMTWDPTKGSLMFPTYLIKLFQIYEKLGQ